MRVRDLQSDIKKVRIGTLEIALRLPSQHGSVPLDLFVILKSHTELIRTLHDHLDAYLCSLSQLLVKIFP